jgi:NAD(P)-dependent dehydrogenase (short-subunit alcohol dehydrogenase family)
VLKGIDLTGKNVIVTGGHAGLGLETTRALAKAGASLTVGSRDAERAAAAVGSLERVDVSRLDLVDPASIEAFAKRWADSKRPLHILITSDATSSSIDPEAAKRLWELSERLLQASSR